MEAASSHELSALTLDDRIEKMHARDRIGALAFVVLLWLTMFFVLFVVWPHMTVGGIKTILVVFGALVLAFNTAAIVAMLRHYSHDKHFIYGLDIKHLDA